MTATTTATAPVAPIAIVAPVAKENKASKSKPESVRKFALAHVASAAFHFEQGYAKLAKFVLAAGGDQEKVQRQFYLGFVAHKLAPDAPELTSALEQRAALLLDKKGFVATAKQTDDRRTQAEHTIYGAARVAWSRLIARMGVKAKDKRGGANNTTPKAAKAEAPKGEAALVSAPKVASLQQAFAYLTQASIALDTFYRQNEQLLEPEAETVNAIKAFVATVKQYGLKHQS